MPTRLLSVSRILVIVAASAAAVGMTDEEFGQSRRQPGERPIQEQERRWNISCNSIHPSAHRFVKQHVAPLLNAGIDAPGALRERYQPIGREASELSDKTLKCFGIEPIAINTGVPFESDFGELHEVLRTAHELIESIIENKPKVLREHYHGELRKRFDELKSGTGRRYPART
mgnify:CR=1 FL=1